MKKLMVVVLLCACGSPIPAVDAGGGNGGNGGGSASDGGGGTGGGTAGGNGGSGGGDAGTGGSGGSGGSGGGSTGDGGIPDCLTHELKDVTVPMRDGKTLAAFLRGPKDPACRLPVVVIQTPYGKDNAKGLWFGDAGTDPLFDSKDYAFLVVDWRGFFGSLAAKVPGNQPFAEDGFDTVEWAGTQPFSTGKVGTWGVSALCVQQYRTASLKPPHLAAAVPIFCAQNNTYEQYYPGGVLRLEYYQFIGFYFGAGIILANPYRSPAWVLAENQYKAADVTAPMLVVSGWYDLHPKGTLQTWDALVTGSPVAAQHRLLIGDWIHFAVGGETAGGRALTAQELKYVDSARRVQSDSKDFFDLHLRGQDAGPAAAWAPVRYVRSGEGTWESGATWPPVGQTTRTYFLAADGGLVTTAPTTGTLPSTYVSLDPSPTVGGGTLQGGLLHGPQIQNAVAARADARVFVSPALAQPLKLRGAVTVSLDVATDRGDTDFAARLTDLQPDGGHLLLAEGIRRLKLRGNLGQVQPVDAGVRYTVPVSFTSDLAYTFKAGHRVGLIVTSSNYPRFERNPNTGADFFPDAGFPAFDANNTLYVNGASTLTLPVDP